MAVSFLRFYMIGLGTIINTLIADLSFVGCALIFCVDVNLVRKKTFRVANMLPALLIPVVVELYRVLLL